MKKLMWRLPIAAVGALALAFAAWHSATLLRAQAPAQTFDGILGIVWGDPHPTFGSGGEIRYTLTLPDGSMLPLQLGPQASALAADFFAKRVVVSGRLVQNPAAPATAENAAVVADTIALNQTLQVEPPNVVFGTRRVIYLLVKFLDDAAVPHPPNFYTDMTNPDTPPAGAPFPTTLNGFFKKTSWNQFSWIADVGGVGGVGAPGGWLTLPNPKSFYAPCGFGLTCANLTALSTDATALGRAQGINFKNYDNINFVLSNDLDCCAWGGGYFSAVDSKSYGATWEPPWGQNTTTYGHEMGHSIGLPHSGWVYYAYDSPWDVMSSAFAATVVNCGSYRSANNGGAVANLSCSEPGGGYITAHKDSLGWIPSANQVVTNTLSSLTVSLEAGSLPLTSAIKMIKICLQGFACTGSTARYLTVEARVKGLGPASQFDNAIPGEGVIIHDVQHNRPAIGGSCFFNSQSGWAVPVDATPGDYNSVNCNPGGRLFPNYGLHNAQWNPGQTFVNSTYGVSVSVVSRTGSTFLVSVIGTNRSAPSGDFDGDGRSDTTVFRPSNGTWYIRNSATGLDQGLIWGGFGDEPVIGDYDGDAKTDMAVFRPSNGTWYVRNSTTGGLTTFIWGGVGDVTAQGDYDGDRKTDIAVFRPSNGTWYIRHSSTGATFALVWGGAGDVAAAGDYDADGKTDIAVFRPSTGTWYLRSSSTGALTTVVWGGQGDIAVPGDYDADGRTDTAVFRASTGVWYIRNSATGLNEGLLWGGAGDIPTPGDFDGDRKTDMAVFRPSNGTWYLRNSTTGASTNVLWGAATDIPVLRRQ